jgi:hypothetical protein
MRETAPGPGYSPFKLYPKPTEKDPVNNPSHYTQCRVECIDVIEDVELDKYFHLANSFKYLWRWDSKGDPIANLKKALWYLERFIQFLGNNGELLKDITESYEEQVDHPDHYNQGKYECIEVIEDNPALYNHYHVSNSFKYLWRWREKGEPIQNLEKAAWYLKRKISLLEEQSA